MTTHLSNRRVPPSPAGPKLESSSAKSRSAHPPSNGHGEGGHTKHHERVHTGDLRAPSVDVLVGDDRRRKADGDGGGDNGGTEVDEAPLAPKVEEAVPRQDLGSLGGSCGLSGGGMSG